MKRYLYTLCFMLASMVLYTSCLKSDSDNNTEYYHNTAIMTFSLSTVNRYVHTTSKSGKDSVYKKALSNPAVFTIDHYQRKIYNTDSLPSDCDLSHILATITAHNNGRIFIKSLVGDTLKVYSNTDSIDFSKPREIRVYANDNTNYRAYEVTISKHQAQAGSLVWEQMSPSDLPSDAIKKLWEAKVETAGLSKFIGAGRAEAYAFSKEGDLMVSFDEGDSWVADILDTDRAFLPTENFAFVSYPFAANDSTDYQLLVGTKDNLDHCVVWRKICEFSDFRLLSKWSYLPVEDLNLYKLPYMESLNLVYFNWEVLAIGDDGKIYISRDQGITWKTNSAYKLPSLITTNHLLAMTDDDGYLWLVGKDTGEVWRGIIID